MANLQRMARPLAEDVQVWRGIRSIEATFGVEVNHLADLTPQVVTRFLSTTRHEAVARGEFTRPGPDPAILKVIARSGTRAVLLPSIGDPLLAYQGEILFRPGCRLRIVTVDPSLEIPVIDVEVSQP